MDKRTKLNMDSQQQRGQQPRRPTSLIRNNRPRRFDFRRQTNHSPPPTHSHSPEIVNEVPYEVPYLYVEGSIDNLERKLMNCTEKMVALMKLQKEIEQETDLLHKAIKLVQSKEQTESNCAICIDELSKNDIAILPQCAHIFHVSCLRSWFATSFSCPTCRQEAHNLDMKRVLPEQAKMFEDLSTSDRLKLVQLLQVT